MTADIAAFIRGDPVTFWFGKRSHSALVFDGRMRSIPALPPFASTVSLCCVLKIRDYQTVVTPMPCVGSSRSVQGSQATSLARTSSTMPRNSSSLSMSRFSMPMVLTRTSTSAACSSAKAPSPNSSIL